MKIVQVFALAAVLLASAGPASPAGREIYPAPSQARADVAAALKTAAATHRRILLDFGGNWCPDCQVLNIYFHDATNLPILNANFVLVDVNVGQFDANLDLAKEYGVPLNKGVPALAVLSSHGKLLYSQQGGEFEDMRHLQSSALTQFLLRWKPRKTDCSAVRVNC